jgi:beta-lactamase regulating signal transducer with metallopeptidase domain
MDATFSALAIAQFWQVTALIVIVAVVNRWLSRKRPHLAHVLWLVVLAKCLTPPLWSSTGGVFCWLQPEQVVEPPVTQLDTEWQAVEWQELLIADSAADQWEPADDSSFAAVPLSDAEAAELLEPDGSSLDVDWPSVLAASWLTSVSVVLFVIAVRWWLFWHRLKRAPRRECPELDQQLAELARQLRVRRVRLLVTESRIGPAVVGLFRKTILLPAIVVDRLAAPVGRIKLCADPAIRGSDAVSTEQLAEQDEGEPCRNGAPLGPAYDSLLPILAHELLHVRRGDLWVGLLQTLAQAVWWFHPLVWWVGRLTNRDAERCCDEEVLAELKCDPAAYARSLLDVLELKSQLAPVPVFPGVRPVDVTSKRLERIMTLGQGCRRRTPWWCWLIALGTAALTLPGAAFVVSAQEETQRAETSSDVRPAPLPAPQADGSPRPAPPVPVGSDADRELRAYQKVNRDSTVTTVVYETAEFAHLLTGTQDEQQQKFERLVHSRQLATDAEIKWFNGKPIVRTTGAGHQAVRDCLSLFAETNATPQHFEEFLDSVTRQPQSTLVVDLQVITLSEDAHRDVEAAVAEVTRLPSGQPHSTIPLEKWQAIEKAIPHDDDYHFVAPRLAVFNGHSVEAESTLVHQEPSSDTSIGKSPQPTDSETSRWTGWKGQVLPFEREDGSCSLGMKFKTGIVSEGNPHPAYSQRRVCLRKTLADDQVIVLTGFPMTFGDGRFQRAVVTARVQSLGAIPSPNALPAPRQLTETRAKSKAAVVLPEPAKAFQPVPDASLPTDMFRPIAFNLSDVVVVRDDGWAATRSKKVPYFIRAVGDEELTQATLPRLLTKPLILSAEPRADSESFVVRADRLLPALSKDGETVRLGGNVSLKLATAGMNARATAACVSQLAPTFVSFYLTDAKLTDTKDGKETVTEAPAITLMLNVFTREVDRIEVNRTGAVVVPIAENPDTPGAPQTPGAPTGYGVVYVGAATNGSPTGILPLTETERLPFAPQSFVAPGLPAATDLAQPVVEEPNNAPAREVPRRDWEIDDRRQILQFGDFRVDIAPATDAGLQRVKAPYERQLFHERVSFHICQPNPSGGLSPQPRLFAVADQSSFRRDGDTLILDLTCNAMLSAGEFSGRVANVNADAIRLTIPLRKSSQGIRCEMRNAVVSFQRCLNLASMSRGDDPEASILRAGRIDLTFDRESMKVTNVSASKVGSLQPATVTVGSVPTEITPLNLPVGNMIGSSWDRLSAEPSLRHLVTLKADNMPLIDVVTELKKSTGLQFVVDSVELEQAGFTTKTPVTVEFEDIWLADALRRILEPLRLGVVINDHDVIQVTGARRMGSKLVAAAYPVADLVMPEIESFVVNVTAALAGITPQWRNTETIGQPSSLRVNELVELISGSIEPDSWRDNGGLGLMEFNESSRSLVVRQTQLVHEQIAGVLSQLRRLKALSVGLQMHTRVVDQGFLEKAGVGVSFEQTSDSDSLRFAKLSQSDVDALRATASWMPAPKVTLLNGQGCHLVLPTLADERFSLWPIISADGRHVSFSTRQNKDKPTGKQPISLLTLEDGAAFLVSLPPQNSDRPYFVIVQADIQAVEEEEELLGVEP